MKKYIIIITSIFVIILGIIFTKIGFNYSKDLISYSYEVQKSGDYEIVLNPNDFYDTKVLPANRYYASKSINSIIINFKYKFEGNKNTNLKYNYNITAELLGNASTNDDLNKEVWSKKYIFLDNKEKSITNQNSFLISELTNIDYQYYRSLVQSYEEKYEIAIDAVLKVRLNVFLDTDSILLSKEESEDYIELLIPINNTVTKVTANYIDTISKDIYTKNETIPVEEIICFIIGGTCIFIPLILLVINLKNFKKSEKEKYEERINRILKSYNDIIITVTTKPQLSDLKTIKLEDINDLIDIAECNQCNIIYYNSNDKREFYVIIDRIVYVYSVKNIQ